MTITRPISLFMFIFLLITILHTGLASASCSTFTATSALYHSESNATLEPGGTSGCRVSPAITCSKEQPRIDHYYTSSCGNSTMLNCYLVGDSYVIVQGFSNSSLSDADTAALFSLASSNVSSQAESQIWSYNVTGVAIGWGFCVSEGQIGYTTFFPEVQCVNGTLSGCNNEPVADGTAVQLCGEMHIKGTIPLLLDGTMTFRYISASEGAEYSGSPNLTSAAARGWALGRAGVGVVETWPWVGALMAVLVGVSWLA